MAEFIYTEDTCTHPFNTPIDNRCMEYHYTKSVSHIAECTYTEDISNSPLQLTIDLWNTITPNKFHIQQNAHILRIHLPPPHLQLTIDLKNTITPNKFHIYQNAHILRIHVPPQLQLTIDLWNTITPHKFHI